MGVVSSGVEIAVDPKQLESIEEALNALSLSVTNYKLNNKIEQSKGEVVDALQTSMTELKTIALCFDHLINKTEQYVKTTRLEFSKADEHIASNYRHMG